MVLLNSIEPGKVHCRVGSLESGNALYVQQLYVHCRVGSLEIADISEKLSSEVHCRVGSLETSYFSSH